MITVRPVDILGLWHDLLALSALSEATLLRQQGHTIEDRLTALANRLESRPEDGETFSIHDYVENTSDCRRWADRLRKQGSEAAKLLDGQEHHVGRRLAREIHGTLAEIEEAVVSEVLHSPFAALPLESRKGILDFDDRCQSLGLPQDWKANAPQSIESMFVSSADCFNAGLYRAAATMLLHCIESVLRFVHLRVGTPSDASAWFDHEEALREHLAPESIDHLTDFRRKHRNVLMHGRGHTASASHHDCEALLNGTIVAIKSILYDGLGQSRAGLRPQLVLARTPGLDGLLASLAYRESPEIPVFGPSQISVEGSMPEGVIGYDVSASGERRPLHDLNDAMRFCGFDKRARRAVMNVRALIKADEVDLMYQEYMLAPATSSVDTDPDSPEVQGTDIVTFEDVGLRDRETRVGGTPRDSRDVDPLIAIWRKLSATPIGQKLASPAAS